MPKILFLTTAHRYNDDRIFYHQAKELKNEGYTVKICSLSSDFIGDFHEIDIESYSILDQNSTAKTRKFLSICEGFQPDCIICSEPLAVIAAHKFSKSRKASIIYDITEWYPSMRMVKNYSFFLKFFHGFKFFLIQIYAGFISTHFIFGEETKKFPLAFLYPLKKKITLPYFPDNQYIKPKINVLKDKEIKLAYTGMISKEKGIENFFNAIDFLIKSRPDIQVNILIIGSTRNDSDEIYFHELLPKYNFKNIEIKKPVSFETFTDSLSEADICFDLREINLENHHCLPIKIFYYAATGKPVIYSDLKATRKEVKVEKFGYLVDPQNSGKIAALLSNYVDDPKLYDLHAKNARKLFKEQYNWDKIRHRFSEFVKKSLQ